MGLNLKIEIDSEAGFCFGVKKAVSKAEQILNSGQELYCLGHIVHNLEEVRRLERLGMQTITHSELVNIKGQNVMIRSHGEPPETYEILSSNNNTIIESTCPIVIKLQEKVKASNTNGDFILIYGKAEHPEVIGVIGQISDNYLVVSQVDQLDFESLPKKLILFSQTTMDLDSFNSFHNILLEKGFEVELRDTICRKVSGKKKKLELFARKHDLVIMVAGEKSSNGKLLFEICKSNNPRSYKVSKVDQISTEWFREGDFVGITGATSTPEWLMQDLADHLSEV